ncbi:DUF2510 domain-containing protein [Streptomyces sp. TR06-5]|uniref:DUF2510 domain-containing protein n=1 Tax=unclassified Streptomyces TaxID=2593676 RepID=UPI00399F8952
MSSSTPPGWYPDPGHAGFGPVTERWWDGAAWTAHTRRAETAGGGFPPRSPSGSRGPLVAVVAAAIAVVLAVAVGAILVGGSDGSRAADDPGPAAGTGAPDEGGGARGGPDDSASPAPESRRPTLAEGVRLPLLAGWDRAPGTHGAAVTTTSYICPLKNERCVRGGASVHVTSAEGDPEKVAGADIAPHAKQSYGKDYYGGIVSHRQVRSEPVEVAGQDGYLVRWRIENRKGPDAWVESVAFPHPDGSGRMLVLRLGFDIHRAAPPVRDMARIVAGAERGTVSEDQDSEAV